MTLTIRLSKAEIDGVDMSQALEYISWNPQSKEFLSKDSGEEHYKLLNFLAKQVAQTTKSCKVSDVGTLYGCSALSFAFGHPSVQVTTYDINNAVPNSPNIKTIANVSNITRKYMSGQLDIPNIVQSDIVLLDIDPHQGTEELKFYQRLKQHGFKGLLLVDDIMLNEGMKAFWSEVDLPKYDITKYGHWTGTGIVVFDENTIDVRLA